MLFFQICATLIGILNIYGYTKANARVCSSVGHYLGLIFGILIRMSLVYFVWN